MRQFSALALLLAGASTAALAGSAPAVPPWGVELSYVDKAVKPGDDFFAYGNGNWLKTAKIPGDRTYAGVNLELNLQNEDMVEERNLRARFKQGEIEDILLVITYAGNLASWPA